MCCCPPFPEAKGLPNASNGFQFVSEPPSLPYQGPQNPNKTSLYIFKCARHQISHSVPFQILQTSSIQQN